MEIVQNIELKIKNINDIEKFKEYIEEEGGMFAEGIYDNVVDNVDIEITEAYEIFEDMIETLKDIIKEFPEIILYIDGLEETTYDEFEYKITYKDNVMKIHMSERFYKHYPVDYDEFVELCEEFNIDDIIDEDEWEAMDKESEDGWYFIEGKSALTKINYFIENIIEF